MDDLLNIFAKVEAYNGKLDETYETLMVQMRELLLGQAAPSVAATAANPAIANVSKEDASTASPQQTKKRLKCLSLLEENESEEAASQAMELGTPVKPLRASNAKLLNVAEELNEQHMASPPAAKAPMPAPRNGKTPNETTQEKESINSNETETNLMPPPPAPPSNSIQTPQNPPEEQSFSRPQRAAKSKVEKNLREPKLNSKLRRPTNSEEVVVKLEHKQRASQMSDGNARAMSKSSISSEASSNKAEESIIVVPSKATSVVVLDSDDDSSKVDNQTNKDTEKEPMRQLRVKIKREKPSMSNEEQNVPPKETENIEANKEPAPVVPTNTTPVEIADATFKAPESVLPPKAHVPLVAIKTEVTTDESTMSSTLLSATTTNSTITSKKGRKKKEPHRPIKVERFSDIDKASPISSRTRKGASETTVDNNAGEQQQKTRAGTLYEDAIDSAPTASNTATPPSRLSQVPSEVLAAAASNITPASATFCNQTMTVSNATMNMGAAPADATYLANATFKTSSNNQNADATVTLNKNSGAGLSDVTFDVQGNANNTTESTSTKHSMVTAQEHDSLITEDESFEQRAAQTAAMPAPKLVKPKAPVPGKGLTAAAKAAYKMPSRNELFNPLVQSPVKMRVEAFEHAASAAAENTKNTRPKRTKENMTPNQSGVGSYTTPTIGKLKAPALGRFLTPTQTSNVPTSATIAAAKKAPSSASKAMAYPKTTVTTTTKPLSRENSGDDFRKGLHLISEERKKQREQKHLLAAQQREAKERERAERIQKLAKEREEKRLKKQMEAEQKKREIEEIQRKLRQQEEAAQAAEAAKIKAAKDREMLMQMKQQQQLLAQQNAAKPKFVMPPPPKPTSKYTFAMLHEDDSTDDEGKTSYKRPPPPTWSRSHVRGEAITRQQYAPTAIIDSFFSVQPTTPDLKLIFPNIDARYLKRNSSALWSTPPRYSELPKY